MLSCDLGREWTVARAMVAVAGYIRPSLEQRWDTMVWKILCREIVSTFTRWPGADNAKA